MFEKEAEKYLKDSKDYYFDNEPLTFRKLKQIYEDGAEFGYNKANEWNTGTPPSSVDNKDLLLQVEKDDFDVGYYHFENKRFYTNDGKEVIPLSWKEIHYPQESER